MENIFEIRDLVKQFNGKTILDIDNLDIKKGLITAVIGPSGVGKSTLLLILNGLLEPDSGSILFEGKDIARNLKLGDSVRRSMAMAFQKPVMFDGTVFDNVAYSLKLRKIPDKEIKCQVYEILELVGLKNIASQKAETISGGEAQRIALARAMVYRPKVLLLDEPTANLDPANVTLIEEFIVHARKKYSTTIIIVTHNMFQAKRLSDISVFMLNGKVVESGTKELMFEQPANEKTKSFISGEMIY